MRNDLTAERLRELLDYDPETGVFRWRVCPNKTGGGRVQAGSIAGRIHRDGHRIINIEGTQLYAHRLAWLYVHGRWPAEEIDHINRNPDDNRITNLREATHGLNFANSRTRSMSGLRGAYRHEGKFVAQIVAGNETKYLGRFDTAEEAHLAYQRKRREIYGDW